MTAKRYFQCSFFLPLIVPSFIWLMSLFFDLQKVFHTQSVTYFLIVILSYSLIFGGIPYLIFLVAALIWTKKQPLNQVLFLVWFAPPAYSLILFLCLSVVTISVEFSFAMLPYGLIVGYCYVLPVYTLYVVLKEIRLLKQAELPPRLKDTKSLL